MFVTPTRLKWRMRWLRTLALSLVTVASLGTATAQEGVWDLPPGRPVAPRRAAPPRGGSAQPADFSRMFSDGFRSDAANGKLGVMARFGYETGPAVGREQGVIPLELMPYSIFNNWMVFGDFRGFRADTDNWGFNIGGGARYYSPKLDRIFGLYSFYDQDDLSGATFRDYSFGLETYGRMWDARSNVYLPTGKDQALLNTFIVPGSQRFVGNRLLYDEGNTFGSSLGGVDFEVGMPLPGKILMKHDVRVYAGWYHFENNDAPTLDGWRGRIQGDLFPFAQTYLQVSNDKVFDTTVVFGAQLSFGGLKPSDDGPKSQYHRLTTPVYRNYNVVVARADQFNRGLTAINSSTGNAYFFEHIASYAAPGGDGTFENPFQTIAQAQGAADAGPADTIDFVWGGSQYTTAPNNSVTLQAGYRLLGDGPNIPQFVSVDRLGDIQLPRPFTTPPAGVTDGAPVLQGAPADAVTLTSSPTFQTEFSGFNIVEPTGRGIVGQNIGGRVLMRQVNVTNAAQQGLFLENTTGNIRLLGSTINKTNTQVGVTGADVVEISGGSGSVTFGSFQLPSGILLGEINNTPVLAPGQLGGRALFVHDLPNQGVVNLTGSRIRDLDGGGIEIADLQNGSQLILNGISIERSLTSTDNRFPIWIRDTNPGDANPFAGSISFRGLTPITITNPSVDAIRIENLANADLSFDQQISISGIRQAGLSIYGNSASMRFNQAISITSTGAQRLPADRFGNPALDIQANRSPGSLNFSTVTIANAFNEAIRIGWFEGDVGGAFYATNYGTDNNINITFNDAVSASGGQPTVDPPVASSDIFPVIGIRDDLSRVAFDGGLAIGTRAAQTDTLPLGADGILIDSTRRTVGDNRATVSFSGTTSINNSLTSNGVALRYLNRPTITQANAAIVQFNTLRISDAVGNHAISAITLPDGTGGAFPTRKGELLIGDLNVVVDGSVDPIETLTPSGLFARNLFNLQVQGSTASIIDANAASAVDISNTPYNIRLGTINSFASPNNGVLLVDNPKLVRTTATGGTTTRQNTFTVTQGGQIDGALGSGFLATNSTALINTQDLTTGYPGQIAVFNLQVTNNVGSGFEVRNHDLLTLVAVNVDSNLGTGLLAVDVPTVTIRGVQSGATVTRSLFTNNLGAAGPTGTVASEIGLFATRANPVSRDGTTTPRAFDWTIGNAQIESDLTGTPAAAVVAESLGTLSGTAGIRGSELNFLYTGTNAVISAGGVGDSAVLINWDSPTTINFVPDNLGNRNVFTMSGAGLRAIAIDSAGRDSVPSLRTDVHQIAILDNVINFAGGTGNTDQTGIFVRTRAASNIAIGRNAITFAPINAFVTSGRVGMEFNLDSNNLVNIFDNTIVDNGLEGTALLFSQVRLPSTINIVGNTFSLAAVDGIGVISLGAIATGISFQSVLPALGATRVNIGSVRNGITGAGNANNSITFPGLDNPIVDNFFTPVGAGLFNGSVIINGNTFTPN